MPPRSLFVVKYWCVLCLLGDCVCWLLISGLWLFGCFYASFLMFGGCWFDFRLF